MLVVETVTFPQDIIETPLEKIFQLSITQQAYWQSLYIFKDLIIMRKLSIYLKENPLSNLYNFDLSKIFKHMETYCREKRKFPNPEYDKFKQDMSLQTSINLEYHTVLEIWFYATESLQVMEKE
jgi:hypothetical protein